MHSLSVDPQYEDISGCVRAIMRNDGFLTVLGSASSRFAALPASDAKRFFPVPATPHPMIRWRAPTRIEMLAQDIVLEAWSKGLADRNGVLLDLRAPGDRLVISCAGVVPGRVIYAMENTARSIPTAKLFLSDKKSLWYYDGIDNLTADMAETVALVRALVVLLKPKVICAIGTSGGGYMAMILAAMLGLDRALAFSPQTVISLGWRRKNQDRRFSDLVDAMYEAISPHEPYDLLDLIQDGAHGSTGRTTQFHIVYSAGDALDTAHASRLAIRSCVSLHEVQGIDHNSASILKERGRLGAILESFVQGTDSEIGPTLRHLAEE